MEFLEFLTLLAITICIGYFAGFMTVKTNHLFVILLGKLWSSGYAKQRYVPIGIAITSCYIITVLLAVDLTTNTNAQFQTVEFVINIMMFGGLFSVGIYHADKRFKKSVEILYAIIKITYATGKSEDEIEIRRNTQNNAKAVLDAMPKSNSHALLLLLFVFDSAMMVFLISLSSGRIRARRFINMKSNEQEEYFATWANNSYLYYAVQALKSMIGFSYYTSPKTWDAIGYNGTFLAGSYMK